MASATGPGYFGLAESLLGDPARYVRKDHDLADVIVAIRALTAATLAQAAATAALIEDAEARKKWSRVIGR